MRHERKLGEANFFEDTELSLLSDESDKKFNKA